MILPIRIFAPTAVDKDNYNAQSLNVREIAIRLDPKKFRITLPYYDSPDERLLICKHIRLVKLPPRLGAIKLFAHLLGQQDILFNLPCGTLSRIYLSFPRFIRRKYVQVQWLEGPMRENLQLVDEGTGYMIRRIFSQADAVVSITDFVAEGAMADFGIQSRAVVPVGVDREVFVYRTREHEAPVKVLFVGHLIERKGAHIVLDAAREFKKTEFTLVGAPRDDFAERLMDSVRREGMKNVRILEPMPHHSLAVLMAESDIMLHPSMIESFSKVVLEGASSGLPSIIFSHYHSPAVINGKTGFQVGSVDEMLEKLRLLIEDRNLRLEMGIQATAHAKRFSWENVTMKWSALFQDLYEEYCR